MGDGGVGGDWGVIVAVQQEGTVMYHIIVQYHRRQAILEWLEAIWGTHNHERDLYNADDLLGVLRTNFSKRHSGMGTGGILAGRCLRIAGKGIWKGAASAK